MYLGHVVKLRVEECSSAAGRSALQVRYARSRARGGQVHGVVVTSADASGIRCHEYLELNSLARRLFEDALGNPFTRFTTWDPSDQVAQDVAAR